MGKEIERKFLVINDSYRESAVSSDSIKQGYLSRDPERTVRVRTRDDKGFLTVKGVTRGCEREEFEYEIPFSDASHLLAMCLPPVIEKIRYIVPFGGRTWEVDVFEGANTGLTVAEIELGDSTEQFPLPDFIGKEVTGDPRYYNSNLK